MFAVCSMGLVAGVDLLDAVEQVNVSGSFVSKGL